jgi:hypothetical protein
VALAFATMRYCLTTIGVLLLAFALYRNGATEPSGSNVIFYLLDMLE